MQDTLKKLLRDIGLYKQVRWVYLRGSALAWRIYNFVTKRQDGIINDYLGSNEMRKIHLGCGNNILDGWLNTDLIPTGKRIRLDVSKRYPFDDNTFDHAYSEHVIEHLPYQIGRTMISEAFRVLKPGGVIRISTPDLKFLIALYEDDKKDIHEQYIKWNAENFIGDEAPHDSISVFNNYVRDWGHVYIYDVESLSRMFKEIGFTDIKAVKINESEHKHLQNLEHESRQPEGFLQLETMTIEGTKPV